MCMFTTAGSRATENQDVFHKLIVALWTLAKQPLLIERICECESVRFHVTSAIFWCCCTIHCSIFKCVPAAVTMTQVANQKDEMFRCW